MKSSELLVVLAAANPLPLLIKNVNRQTAPVLTSNSHFEIVA